MFKELRYLNPSQATLHPALQFPEHEATHDVLGQEVLVALDAGHQPLHPRQLALHHQLQEEEVAGGAEGAGHQQGGGAGGEGVHPPGGEKTAASPG